MGRRSLFVALAVLLLFAPGLLLAQDNPFVGTWVINLAKSKATPGPLPKSRTITMTDAGNGSVNVTIQGVAGDGSKVSCRSTYKADGKEYPLTGRGCPGGGDTISVKSVNANTHREAFKKSGKIVQATEVIVAADGKSRTSSSKGTGADGKATSSVYVYDKQ